MEPPIFGFGIQEHLQNAFTSCTATRNISCGTISSSIIDLSLLILRHQSRKAISNALTYILGLKTTALAGDIALAPVAGATVAALHHSALAGAQWAEQRCLRIATWRPTRSVALRISTPHASGLACMVILFSLIS